MADRKRKTPTKNAQLATTGSNLRLQSPASSRKPKPRAKVARAVAHEVNPMAGFIGFLREYTVITLAIGFVIATQVQGLVKQLVADFVNPLSQLFFGTQLSQRTFMLHFHDHSAKFAWGDLAYGFVDFLFVLVIIYLIIKAFHLHNLDKPKNK